MLDLMKERNLYNFTEYTDISDINITLFDNTIGGNDLLKLFYPEIELHVKNLSYFSLEELLKTKSHFTQAEINDFLKNLNSLKIPYVLDIFADGWYSYEYMNEFLVYFNDGDMQIHIISEQDEKYLCNQYHNFEKNLNLAKLYGTI